MVVRPEQIAALSAASVDSFESKVVGHLNRCFPEECAALTEAGVRDTIRYGIERAQRYGISASREVCTYIDLMIVFGPDFDDDPKLPWATSILNGRGWDTVAKMDQLYQAAQQNYHQRRSHP